MATDPKPAPSAPSPKPSPIDVVGIRIFTYPKVIFMFPTLIVAVICFIGMMLIGDRTVEHKKAVAEIQATPSAPIPSGPADLVAKHDRFKAPENLLGVLFLGVFAFNLLMMAIDFPRFTIVAMVFLLGFAVFFILWLGAYFNFPLMSAVRHIMASVYTYANAEFYGLVSLILTGILLIVYLTRWLDYWQILPNEILHHHGPLSDLERFPTMNLKFDKEIPDVLEFMFLGSGRLVLHVTDEKKAIVLDNVLFINAVERALKNLMSRMEVRITTDQETANI